MPTKKHNALSALRVKTINVPGKYTDGNGLTLLVEESGTKRWIQRVTIVGKQRNLGLGGYPAVSLALAREVAVANHQAIRAGRDVIAERKEARAGEKQPVSTKPTFAEDAAAFIEFRSPTWSNAKHRAQWESTLTTYAAPVIGQMPIDEITTANVMAVLTPIWTEKHETASRVRQRMEAVFDWAMNHGHRSDNPAEKRFLKSLPRMRKTKQHHRALPYPQVPASLEMVRRSTANAETRLAFEFLVLTASRSGEVRHATWDEIDWATRTWTIPEQKMKARRIHIVPLASQALEILQKARELSDGMEERLIFPANRSGEALSDMAFTVMLRRLEIPAVPHGFRRSFKTWTLEKKVGTREDTEASLSHKIGNDDTEEAYIDTDLLQTRRSVMEQWAEFLQPTG